MSVYIIRNGYGDIFYDFEGIWFLLSIMLAIISHTQKYKTGKVRKAAPYNISRRSPKKMTP